MPAEFPACSTVVPSPRISKPCPRRCWLTLPPPPTSTWRNPASETINLRFRDDEFGEGDRRRESTILEVVNDNKPFLLDSTLAELQDQGYEPRLVAHPILAVARDPNGKFVSLAGEATGRARKARGVKACCTSISRASTHAAARSCASAWSMSMPMSRWRSTTGPRCAAVSPR